MICAYGSGLFRNGPMHDVGRHGQTVPSCLCLAHFGDEIGNPPLRIQGNYLYHAAAALLRYELRHANVLQRLHIPVDIIRILHLILLVALARLNYDQSAIFALQLHVSGEQTPCRHHWRHGNPHKVHIHVILPILQPHGYSIVQIAAMLAQFSSELLEHLGFKVGNECRGHCCLTIQIGFVLLRCIFTYQFILFAIGKALLSLFKNVVQELLSIGQASSFPVLFLDKWKPWCSLCKICGQCLCFYHYSLCIFQLTFYFILICL